VDGVLAAPGLGAPVEILRDGHGIPLVRAQSEEDGYFALGFLHAQDRLWQMDFQRRAVSGRLAEILGQRALPHDRFVRTLGLDRLGEQSLGHLDAEVRAALEAYADGVNAYLAAHRGAWPPEFTLLRYRPEPWRPVDSLLWGRLMTLRLSRNWRSELLQARLLARLTPEQVAELWPPGADDALKGVTGNAVTDLSSLYRRLALDRLWAALPAGPQRFGASNNWAVAGTRTTTGKPVLANDVHLPLGAPGVWYLARIEAPGLVLAGATAPGVPFLVAGHNGRMAWGFTTTESDTQDLFIERLDGADPGRYLTPEGSRAFSVRDEVIAVRGGEDARITVREGRHGPVISDVVAGAMSAAAPGGAGRYVISLADAALTGNDRTAQALYRMNHARDADSFVAALRDFHAPHENIVFAHVDGTIGFYAPARVPVRKAGIGLRPVPGWSGAYDWTGLIPFAELPHVVDPPSGRVVTANHQVVGDDYPYLLTARWPEPYRARRIHELLDRDPAHSPDAAAAIQRDTVSLLARDLLPLLLAAPAASEAAASARRMLARWDGRMARDRPEPLVFSAWLSELNRALYADELGPLFEDVFAMRPRFVEAVLSRLPRWCDDVATAEPEGCDEVVSGALARALSGLAERFGEDMESWRWGAVHSAHFPHPVLDRVPGLRSLASLRIASDGDDATVNRGTFRIADRERPFAHIHGPGLRAVYDLAGLDRSLFMIAPGQSGNPLSARYRDLLAPWRDGEYVRLAPAQGGPGAAARDPAHRLVLVPAAGG
jgi:penicillin amidase